MRLTAGTRLGVYEVIAQIGAGGMGEVYRARDTRLNRDVAIKTLPGALHTDPGRTARFEREAQALATLNHPHIGQIYGVEEVGGHRFLVLEYIAGRTLADVIRTGALPLADALPIARQILDALETAHDRGIVHRDLKPANIMVTDEGVAKVLDFGLARVGVDSAIDFAGPSAQTLTAPTAVGVILGTAAYMAPEQARGLVADRRSDVWAFGCVFYEMLAGRRAFQGEDSSDTLALVLRGEPDWSALPADLPPGVRTLIQRCLTRERKARVPEIGAARFLLDDAVAPAGDPAPATAPVTRVRERLLMGASILIAIAALGAAAWMRTRPASVAPDKVEFTISPPAGERFTQSFSVTAISPDGQHIAFTTTTDDHAQLWIRNLDDASARQVPGIGLATQLFWSPDSRSVAFIEGVANGLGKLKRVDVATGRIQTLAEGAMGTGAWSPSGVIVITGGSDKRLYRLPDSGGQLTPLTELDQASHENGHWWPTFLPDGRRFLYQAISGAKFPANNAWYLSSLDAPSVRTRVGAALSSVSYAQGRLFFQRDGTLMTQPFDERAGRLAGDAVEIADGILHTATNGRAALSVSSTGTIVYRATTYDVPGVLTWLDAGKPAGTLGEPATYWQIRFSPDGSRLAVARANGAQDDIWTIDVARNVPSRLTSDPRPDRSPAWSPDGNTLFFASTPTSVFDIYKRAIDGSTTEEIVWQSAESKWPTSVSRDGVLLFDRDMAAAGTGRDIWALPLTPGGTPFPVLAGRFDEIAAHFAPDGHWISYLSDESGRHSVHVAPFPVTGQSVRVSTDPADSTPLWSGDGKKLYYSTGKIIKVVDMTSPLHPGPPREVARTSGVWAVDPKTGRLLILDTTGAVANDTPLTVIMNWTAAPKK